MTKKHIINQTIFSYVAAEVSEGQCLCGYLTITRKNRIHIRRYNDRN